MGWRGTIALAALLLVAGSYAYYDIASDPERPEASFGFLGETRPTPPGQGDEPLVSFTPHEIDSVRLRRGAVDVAVRRAGSGWSGGADGIAMDDFLASLSTLSRIATLDVPAEQLADHGLGPPQAIIGLERDGNPPIEIRIGDRNPPATAVYVQVGAESRVFLTGALLLWELDKALQAVKPVISNQ